MKKVLRYNTILKMEMDAKTDTFDVTLNVPFDPDLMNIKYSSYFNDGAGVPVLYLYTNLVNQYISTLIDSRALLTMNTTFTIEKSVQGLYTFSIHDAGGGLVSSEDGIISVHLEFLKYIN